MADAGLFIGWGAPVRGREAKSLEVFSEALAWLRNTASLSWAPMCAMTAMPM